MEKQKTRKVFLHRLFVVLVCALLALTVCVGMSAGARIGASASVVEDSLGRKFKPETANPDEARANAEAVSVKIAEEGMTLLKNNGALPLDVIKGNKISVFGKNSVAPVFAGSGSGGSGAVKSDVYSSLREAGFDVNPDLKAFYEDDKLSGSGRPKTPAQGSMPSGYAVAETPAANYTDDVKTSLAAYSDAAVVFLTRIGGEGFDLPTTSYAKKAVDKVDANGNKIQAKNEDGTPKVDKEGNPVYEKETVEEVVPGRESASEHYLQLDKNERDMIKMATDNFDKVIVLLNVGTTMEIKELEDNDKIDSVLWVGNPGGLGYTALGRILNGTVNPSGRTVDTYAADFKKDPTWQNFAVNAANGKADQINNQYWQEKDGVKKETKYRAVEYEEGIYVGYRYYETRGYTEWKDSGKHDWYNDAVVYPFGYGLSYTDFEWDVTFPANKAITKDGKVKIDVKVTNTGKFAGKDVVQLYYSAPYLAGEIEKSHVVLGGFAKTELLQPGKSDTVSIEIDAYTMASYDYNDANMNDFTGWELDAGNYTLYVGKNAHDAWTNGDSAVFSVAEGGIKFDKDLATGTTVENRFNDVSGHFDGGNATLMSRSNWDVTFPTYLDKDKDLEMDIDTFNRVELKNNAAVIADDKESDPWYTTVMPTQAADASATKTTKLAELSGLAYDDPKWETFMNQLSVKELTDLVGKGSYQICEIDRLGIPGVPCFDGPAGFVNDRGYLLNFYPTSMLVASTWNVELADEQGDTIAEEALWAFQAGMYAMATNTHRSPFSGRNFEYYSEDQFLAGKICAAVTKAMSDKGMITFVKHFAVNDQETNRDTTSGLITWANEQTMREIYLKSFEITVKEGKPIGMMSSFNRIGLTPAAENYALLTEVLREEWGFRGSVVTDFGSSMNDYVNINSMIRAGNDLFLGTRNIQLVGSGSANVEGIAVTPTQVTALRKSAKNSLYAVANSLAMNRLGAYGSEFISDSFSPADGAFGLISLGHDGKTERQGKGGNTAWLRPEGVPASVDWWGNPKPAVLPSHIARGETVNLDLGSKIFGTDGKVKYVGSGFPEGLTVDENTGVLGGTVASTALDGYYIGTVALYTPDGKNLGQCVRVQMTILKDSPAQTFDAMKYEGVSTATASRNIEFAADVSVSGGVTRYIKDEAGAWGRRILTNFVKNPIEYSVSKGTLPEGLWISPEGVIRGKTTAAPGDYKVTIKAESSEAGVQALETEITVKVVAFGALTYAGSTLTAATKDAAYTASVATATGSDTITYSATGLPAGLTMDDKGNITGTPTAAGTFTVTVKADSFAYDGATATFKLVVADNSVDPEPTPDPKPTPDPEKPGGCNGCNGTVTGIGSVVIAGAILLVGIAVIIIRKKKQDK